MDETLDAMIVRLEAELRVLFRAGSKGPGQKVQEQLATLRAAKFVEQGMAAPITDIEKPDAKSDTKPDRRVDLAFRCGDEHFVLEHTAIGAFQGQRAWQESGRLVCPLPGSLEELPRRRQERVGHAFDEKLDKLQKAAAERRTAGLACTSILLLEFEDYWHSGPYAFLEAIEAVLPGYRDRLPEEVHLVGTCELLEDGVKIPGADVTYAISCLEYRGGRKHAGFFGPLRWWNGRWELAEGLEVSDSRWLSGFEASYTVVPVRINYMSIPLLIDGSKDADDCRDE